MVYALDAERVLRVHRHEAADHVRRIGELYDALDRAAVPYALPEVLEVHGDGEVSWSIERRLAGPTLRRAAPPPRRRRPGAGADRLRRRGRRLRALGPPRGWPGGCGELFTAEQLRAERWGDLLADRLALQLEQARPVLERRPSTTSTRAVAPILGRGPRRGGRRASRSSTATGSPATCSSATTSR